MKESLRGDRKLLEKSIHTKKYDRFRELLIQARRKACMTQTEVAKRLSNQQSYVSKYERGERRLDVIEFLDIARVINCDPMEIIGRLQA